MLAVVLAGIDSAVSLPARSERQRRENPAASLALAAIGTLVSLRFFPVPVLQGNSKAFHIEVLATRSATVVHFDVSGGVSLRDLLPVMVACVRKN